MKMECYFCKKNFFNDTFRKQEIRTQGFQGQVPEYWLKIENKTYIFCGYICCNKFYEKEILSKKKPE